jgi:glycosyltransferase involved in cell wall biosynthesis
MKVVKTQAPDVSVIMSVWNGARFLAVACESILRQSHSNFEFIVIDDGSTDASARILASLAERDPRMHVATHANLGLTKSLNEALDLSNGEFIARMDADDICAPARLERQLAAFDRQPGLVLVGSGVELISEDGATLGPRRQPHGHSAIRRELLRGNGGAMTHPAIMFRRDVARRVGGFDERFVTAQDLDFFLRISEAGEVENLQETLLYWRQHPGSVNRRHSSTWTEMKALAIRETIDRIGSDRFAREMFLDTPQFSFPGSPADLGRFALRNGRPGSAVPLLLKTVLRGPRRAAAVVDVFKALLMVAKHFLVPARTP